MEVYYGCDRISNDIAFLMVWAVALRDGVTPLDDWQRIGSAMLPALLVGFLGVAGVSYVLNKYVTSKDAAEMNKMERPQSLIQRPYISRSGRRRRVGNAAGEALGVGAVLAGIRMAQLLESLRPSSVLMMGTGGVYGDELLIGQACVARRIGYVSGVARMGLGYTPDPRTRAV